MEGRHSSGSTGCEGAGPSIAVFDARSAALGPAEVLGAVLERLEALPSGGLLKIEVGFEPAAGLEPGEFLLARLPRFPRLLVPQLAKRGLYWEIYEERDRTALVHPRRPR